MRLQQEWKKRETQQRQSRRGHGSSTDDTWAVPQSTVSAYGTAACAMQLAASLLKVV
jgi:hypothetical protein